MIPGTVLPAPVRGPLRYLAAVALVSLASVAVLTGAVLGGFVGVPTVEGTAVEVGDVNETHTEVWTTVTVDNPNPVGADGVDTSVEYVVTANGIAVASGTDDLSLEPGSSTESIVTPVRHATIPEWWVSHVRKGERTEVVVESTVSVGPFPMTDDARNRTIETDLLSPLESTETRRIEAPVPVAEDATLYVEETRADWGDVDADRTEVEFAFVAHNPTSHDVPVTGLGYTVAVNDVALADGELDRRYLLESNETTTLTATAVIENDRLEEAWLSHLDNDETSTLRIEFEADAELPTGSTVTLPLDALAHEETIETDLQARGGFDDGLDREVARNRR